MYNVYICTFCLTFQVKVSLKLYTVLVPQKEYKNSSAQIKKSCSNTIHILPRRI